MKNRLQILTILTALIFLVSLTGCKTIEYVYVYPEVIEQTVPDEPTHEPWTFSPVDGGQFLTDKDAQEIYKYIIRLRNYGDSLKIKLEYYINEIASWKNERE